MNIYLGNISSPDFPTLPYSCAALQSYAMEFFKGSSKLNWCEYLINSSQGVEALVDTMNAPSLIALSVYEWNLQRSLKLCKIAKKKWPGVRIVLGGPSIPENEPLNFLVENPFVDVLSHLEGEENFLAVINALEAPSDQFFNHLLDCPNLSLNIPKNRIETQKSSSSRIQNPINYQGPISRGLLDKYVEEFKKDGLPVRLTWETTRGCPFSCSFCDWGSYTHQKIRPFKIERLNEEILWIAKHVNELLIADANFGILARDIEIIQRLIKTSKNYGQLKAVLLAFTKNTSERSIEIGALLSHAGLLRTGVTLSVQSHTPAVIQNIKRQNIKTEKFSELQNICNERGIYHYTELILPLPGETKSSFLESLELTLAGNPSEIRVWPLQLYPNAEISNKFTREKYAFKTEKQKVVSSLSSDENEYVEAVIATKDLDSDQCYFLKRISKLVDLCYMGKWLFFIIEYVFQEKKIKRVHFLDSLISMSLEDENSILCKAFTQKFIQEINNGNFDKFVGERSPYGVSWNGRHFNAITFHWLCLAENRKQFFAEILTYMKALFPEDTSTIEDLIRFQNWIIFDFENYNPKKGKIGSFYYNWHEYFTIDADLKQEPCQLEAHDHFVGDGNSRSKIDFSNPDCIFLAAGGDTFYRRKSNVCIHDLAALTTN